MPNHLSLPMTKRPCSCAALLYAVGLFFNRVKIRRDMLLESKRGVEGILVSRLSFSI